MSIEQKAVSGERLPAACLPPACRVGRVGRVGGKDAMHCVSSS